jgi:hypothetical protein
VLHQPPEATSGLTLKPQVGFEILGIHPHQPLGMCFGMRSTVDFWQPQISEGPMVLGLWPMRSLSLAAVWAIFSYLKPKALGCFSDGPLLPLSMPNKKEDPPRNHLVLGACLVDGLTLYHYVMSLLLSVFLLNKLACLITDVTSLPFFWVVFAWCIFSHHYTCKLSKVFKVDFLFVFLFWGRCCP